MADLRQEGNKIMAIGDTVNAGLMRIDTSAYERAGQANANANLAFGNALNQVAKGYIEGQEKRARADEIAGYLMNQGVGEKDAKAIAKNPFLQKEYQRKKSAEQDMKIEQGRLGMQAQQINARERMQKELTDREDARYRDQQNRLMQKEQSDRNIAKFNFARPEMPITEDTPGEKMPELDPDPFAPPPSTFLEDSRAVTMLPERFQGQGRQVQDAVESGQLSPLEGNRIIGSIYSQAMAEQKTGLTPSEELAREKFEYDKSKDQKLEDEKNKPKPPVYQERTLLAIDDALKILNDSGIPFIQNLPVAGFAATMASEIGGTDAANLRQAIATIESSIGFDRLKKMREESPTGGALGQVSERELALLNASLGSLSQMQSEEQLRTNLERVRTHYDNFIKSINARNQGLSADNLDSGYKMLNMGSPAIDEADLDRQIQEKQKQLQMRNTLDNPNMPNYGNQFR